MPRPPRLTEPGVVYHVLNRRVMRLAIFDKAQDYDALCPLSKPHLCAAGRRPHDMGHEHQDRDSGAVAEYSSATAGERTVGHGILSSEGVLQSGVFKWRPKLSDQLTFAEVKLRPVLPPGKERVADTGEIELRIAGRRSIVVRPGFDRQTLMEVLEVLDVGSVGSAEMARREADR